MSKPDIQTAIPRRRYKLGEFTLILLGEIVSGDGTDYQHIMAVVRDNDPEPGLYITAEKDKSAGADRSCSMRIMMRDGSEIIGNSAEWCSMDAFLSEALVIVAKVLDLTDEIPRQLL